MAPTLVVPSVAEDEQLKEFNNVQNYSYLQITQYFFKKLLLKYQPNFFFKFEAINVGFLMIVVFFFQFCGEFSWRRDIPISVSDNGTSETLEFCVDPRAIPRNRSQNSNPSLVLRKPENSQPDAIGRNSVISSSNSSQVITCLKNLQKQKI